MDAVDVSNYTDALTTARLTVWRDVHDVGLVIAQAVDPPPGYPPTQTRQQLQVCASAGMPVDAYVWLWFDLPLEDIRRKLALLDGSNVRRLWLDVEDAAAGKYDQAATEAKVTAALELCDAYATTSGLATGIYSGFWYWADADYLANTAAFAARDLWDAHYDLVDDPAAGWLPYGGWTHNAIKQYRGTTSLADIGGVDLNVLSAEEADRVSPAQPDSNPCAGLINGLADVADRMGDLLLAECTRPTVRKTVVRTIVADMQRVRAEEVGPRPAV